MGICEVETLYPLRGEDENVQESGFLWILIFLQLLISVLSLIIILRRLYLLDIQCMLLALGKSVFVPLR